MRHPITITALYAAGLAMMLVWLSFNVIRLRRQQRISLLDGGNAALTQAMRAHGNFTEYVPLVLILMAILELDQAPGALVHGIGLTLLAGRVSHACGLIDGRSLRPRVAGMMLTFASLGLAAAAVLLITTGIL